MSSGSSANDELQRIGIEATMVYFKVLSQHLAGARKWKYLSQNRTQDIPDMNHAFQPLNLDAQSFLIYYS
jgi:hypothetical protein